MMTLATVEVDEKPKESYRIYVDIDDNGWAYLKQGDDWVVFPVKQIEEVQRALMAIRWPFKQ